MNQTKNKPSLSKVAEEFERWRASAKRHRTPEHLQQQAVELLTHYRISEVINGLGLCHKVLKRWKQRWHERTETTGPVGQFISLPSEPLAVKPSTPVLALKLSQQSIEGNVLSIEGELMIEHWRSALELLELKR